MRCLTAGLCAGVPAAGQTAGVPQATRQVSQRRKQLSRREVGPFDDPGLRQLGPVHPQHTRTHSAPLSGPAEATGMMCVFSDPGTSPPPAPYSLPNQRWLETHAFSLEMFSAFHNCECESLREGEHPKLCSSANTFWQGSPPKWVHSINE